MNPPAIEDVRYLWKVERKGLNVDVYRVTVRGAPPSDRLPPYWSTRWYARGMSLAICHRWMTMPDYVHEEVEKLCQEAHALQRSPWNIRRIGEASCHWTTILVLVVVLAMLSILLRSYFGGG